MAWSKKLPAFWSILSLLGVIFIGEGGLWQHHRKAARRAEAQLLTRQRRFAGFAAAAPFPGGSPRSSVAVDPTRAESELAVMQAGLTGKGEVARRIFGASAPLQATDMFFDIAGFVEKTREQARQAGVMVKDDERFGFSAYATHGPALGLIPFVFRQRQIASYLLQALFEARPVALLAVQRERPPGAGENEATGADKNDAEYLTDVPPFPATGPDLAVKTVVFRLIFTGQTVALRTLLNTLAGCALPLSVCGVEVEPVSGPDPHPAGSIPSAVLPLVPALVSRFTVTIVSIDPVAAGKPVATEEPEPKPARWTAPPSQSHGAEWIYEVFTPPAIYYDPALRFFGATPPGGRPVTLELAEVRTHPYRLQLIGYVGAAGGYQGAFANELTGATMLARAGTRFPGLGITVRRFEVRKICRPDPAGRSLLETEATAVVLDEQTGKEIVLTSLERCYTGAPSAMLVIAGGSGAGLAHELHEGESFAGGGGVYHLDKLGLCPPGAVVSMASATAVPSRATTFTLKATAAVAVAVVRPAGPP